METKVSINKKTLHKELIASNMIQEDYIQTNIAHPNKKGTKPWKEPHCPANAESPFGDFPAVLKPKTLNKSKKLSNMQESEAKKHSSSAKKLMKEEEQEEEEEEQRCGHP